MNELKRIWQSALKFYRETIEKHPDYVAPVRYGTEQPRPSADGGIEPIPFSRFTTLPFPTDALPKDIAEYVKAVAESTQTPVDMAGTVALSILSVCLQGKYRVQGKADWLEPLNTYSLIIAMPSERKSAVQHMMLRPLNTYEMEYNQRNAAAVESSKMRKRILEKRQKAIEDKVAKGNAEVDEMEQIAREIASFVEQRPLQLYVDDITTEKLVSVISANDGRAALISSEGGIFDTLAGICKCDLLRCADDNGASNGQCLQQGKVNVAGAWRSVENKIVQFAPVGISNELLQGTGSHTATPERSSGG
jgi:hypothetical protein